MPDIWQDDHAVREFEACFFEDLTYRAGTQVGGGGRAVKSLAEWLPSLGSSPPRKLLVPWSQVWQNPHGVTPTGWIGPSSHTLVTLEGRQVLGRSKIRARNLVDHGVDGSFRAISYDLRVGTVIKPGGETADHYVLPPQGIVEVVSEERLTVPGDVVGIAMVKTGLSNQGLLALNIGIIDPGYEGKIGSFFVNFGKREHVLKKGDVFLRVVFHEVVAADEAASKPAPVDDAKYISDKRINMETNFGKEFLDIARVTERFAKEQFEAYRTRILGLVATGAFVLAILTFMLNFGNLMLVQRFLQPNDMTKAELLKEALDRNSRDLADQNKALLTRVQQLDQTLRSTLGRLEGANRRIDEIERRTQPAPAPPRNP